LAVILPVDLVCATTGAGRMVVPWRDEGREGAWYGDNGPFSIAYDYVFTVE
jgi:hypothetical protein